MGFVSPRTAPFPVSQLQTGLPTEDGTGRKTCAHELSGQQAAPTVSMLCISTISSIQRIATGTSGEEMLPPPSLLSFSLSTQAYAEAQERKPSSLEHMDQVAWRVLNVISVQGNPSRLHLPQPPGWAQKYSI